jgi:alpha-N-arabinofuranosidase
MKFWHNEKKEPERRIVMRMLHNPILPGFYPDPSICRAGSDYYMVTSTFEYFPGVPVFHSRDLVHWRQIGHCLTRPSQLPLPEGTLPSKGIYAPTIRWHRGTFYMVTTLVRDNDYHNNINFYVTADDPAGPWSEPIVIEGADGIDPTIFFTGDKAYYLGNMRPDPNSGSARHIWLQELDLRTGTLLGDRHILRTDGALYNVLKAYFGDAFAVDQQFVD